MICIAVAEAAGEEEAEEQALLTSTGSTADLVALKDPLPWESLPIANTGYSSSNHCKTMKY